MYHINYNSPISIHFIGIGGISMSGLAELLMSRRFKISGSDSHESALTSHLRSLGCEVFIGQDGSNISDGTDLAVYTAAIHSDNPEYAECVRRGIPLLTRAELLGQIMGNYGTAIGVSGTHGKTTTTSMLSEILMLAQTDPTISVGGMLPSIGGNMRIGHSDVFLTEACEYTNSFLSMMPTIEVILNVEEDHLDFFKDIDDIRHSFCEYVKLLPKDGSLIINSAIDNLSYFKEAAACPVVTFGLSPEGSDYYATDFSADENGDYGYRLWHNGEAAGQVSLKIPGIHNVLNSLAAIAAAVAAGVPLGTAIEGVGNYSGVDRRFQVKGKCNGFTIVDDYAHHPAEITATLNAAKLYPHNEIWCIFQPHTYTRTKAFLEDFAKALAIADHVVLAPIYAAREADIYNVSSKDIQRLIEAEGKACSYFDTFEEIENFIKDNCKPNDLVITMGAGNILEVGEHLIKG